MSKSNVEIGGLKIQFVPADTVKVDPAKLVVKTLTADPSKSAHVVCTTGSEASKMREALMELGGPEAEKHGFRLDIQSNGSKKDFFVTLINPTVNIEYTPTDPLKDVLKRLLDDPTHGAHVICPNRDEASRLRDALEAGESAQVAAKKGYRLEIQNNPTRKSFYVTLTRPEMRVEYVPSDSLPKAEPPRYQFILETLLAKGNQDAVISCVSEKEATEISRGFHSSGTGRRLKREGYEIQARRAPDDNKVVHVHVEKTELGVAKAAQRRKKAAANPMGTR